MSGAPYSAGGIASTVRATRAASDDELTAHRAPAGERGRAQRHDDERVEVRLRADGPRRARARCIAASPHVEELTFLGAHVVPPEYADRADDYVALVVGRDARRLRAARAMDRRVLRPRRVRRRPGARDPARGQRARAPPAHPCQPAAARSGCADRRRARTLPRPTTAPTSTTPTSTRWRAAPPSPRCCRVPSSPRRSPYPDARRLLDAGATVALAADCNPGSSYTTSIPFCIALAVRDMRMTPSEALWSATAGGARALRRDDVGALRVGARGDLRRARRTQPPAPGLPSGCAARAHRGPPRSRRPRPSLARPRSSHEGAPMSETVVRLDDHGVTIDDVAGRRARERPRRADRERALGHRASRGHESTSSPLAAEPKYGISTGFRRAGQPAHLARAAGAAAALADPVARRGHGRRRSSARSCAR